MSDQYLQDVLESQTLAFDSDEMNTLRSHRADVEKLLCDSFEESSPTIRYGGSKAKGTMIREGYDLDIICYFEHEDTSAGDTLQDIYNNVEGVLSPNYLVERKPSALRLKSRDINQYALDFHIDVVPGRFTDDSQGDVFLYRSSGEKCRQKTNLDIHIAHVKDSQVIDAIRLGKLWRSRNGLSVKHFVLELLIIELLKDKKGESITSQMEHIWTEMRDNIEGMTVEDPANPTGNDLSESFNSSVRFSLSSVAETTLRTIEDAGWESVFGKIEKITEEEKSKALRGAAAIVVTPSQPWLRRG